MKEVQYKDYVGETREYRKGMIVGFALIFMCLTLFASLFVTGYVFNRYDDKVEDLLDLRGSIGGGTGGGDGGTGGGDGGTGGGDGGTGGGDGGSGGGGDNTGGSGGQQPTDVPVVTQAPTQPPVTEAPGGGGPVIVMPPQWDPNGAISLDSTRYAISEQNVAVTNNNSCSFMVWVNLPASFTDNNFIMAAVDGSGQPGWSFALSSPDTLRFAFYNTSNGVEIVYSNPVPALAGTGWHLVGFSFEPGNVNFMVDDTIYADRDNNNRNMRPTTCALQLNGFNGHSNARDMINDYAVAQCIILNRPTTYEDMYFLYATGKPDQNAYVPGMTHKWNLNDISEGGVRPNRAQGGPANNLSIPNGFLQITGP